MQILQILALARISRISEDLAEINCSVEPCLFKERMGIGQSQKNPVSASAMLTGKFLRIRNVFATSSLLAEEFPNILENVQILHKISR